jgi:hypothetical protein
MFSRKSSTGNKKMKYRSGFSWSTPFLKSLLSNTNEKSPWQERRLY